MLQVGPGESVHKWKKGADCQSVCKGLREGVNESYQVDRALQVVLPNTSEFCDKPAAPRAIAPGGGQGKKGK